MDLLKKAAKEFEKLLSTTYYFEIARKNIAKKFALNFIPEDFHHICGLHKLKDIGLVQTGPRGRIYQDIIKNKITFADIVISNYYDNIADRINFICNIGNILDSNQIIFKYMEKSNQISRIEADYLLQNAHQQDIIYIFLNERAKTEKTDLSVMCCRSFFPMDKLDYTKNQSSYTLLKKIKVDIITGEKTVQYDRSRILVQAKQAASGPERKSIMQQLNEKKAQMAINTVLAEKNREKNKHEHERS